MGFLSAYDGINRVVIGDPSRGYWVDLREHVPHGGREKAERALVNMTVVDGKTSLAPDVTEYRQLLLLASIAAWNLDDDNGVIWPITLENVLRLPGSVFDDLWKKIDETNAPRSAEENQQFRDGSVRSTADGDGSSADSGDVSDGARTVAAAWPSSRGSR